VKALYSSIVGKRTFLFLPRTDTNATIIAFSFVLLLVYLNNLRAWKIMQQNIESCVGVIALNLIINVFVFILGIF
jgi:hypothetical protein